MDSPLIGLTSYPRNAEDEFHLTADYCEAVVRASGTPILLPPVETDRRGLLERIDGLILTGGGDIEPARYGGTLHEKIYAVNSERDHGELELARLAVMGRIPMLAICRGLQVLNVALGGTLIEHLPDEVGTRILHRSEAREPVRHAVRVEPRSRLAAVLGDTQVEVSSWHHQAIRKPGEGLKVVARASDGTIEGVEIPDQRWLMGVQWHPEITAHEEAVHQRLFDGLVGAARAFREVRHAA
ncbi:MAG: gamma-glutamyl-gamma-aminobutyrate hydrolase family protein [Nitrospirae bacterium]|nr:gamma-glutamyl-gamma-aminobutyrate hydrolase family protein [Nitrospirota bacterium]